MCRQFCHCSGLSLNWIWDLLNHECFDKPCLFIMIKWVEICDGSTQSWWSVCQRGNGFSTGSPSTWCHSNWWYSQFVKQLPLSIGAPVFKYLWFARYICVWFWYVVLSLQGESSKSYYIQGTVYRYFSFSTVADLMYTFFWCFSTVANMIVYIFLMF